MGWLDALINYGLVEEILHPSDIEKIHKCFARQGKRKGLILKTAPTDAKKVRIPALEPVWAALMLTFSHNRVSFMCILSHNREQREVFERISNWTQIGFVIRGLNSYGQRPFEFNMAAHDLGNPPAPEVFATAVERGIDIHLAKRAYA